MPRSKKKKRGGRRVSQRWPYLRSPSPPATPIQTTLTEENYNLLTSTLAAVGIRLKRLSPDANPLHADQQLLQLWRHAWVERNRFIFYEERQYIERDEDIRDRCTTYDDSTLEHANHTILRSVPPWHRVTDFWMHVAERRAWSQFDRYRNMTHNLGGVLVREEYRRGLYDICRWRAGFGSDELDALPLDIPVPDFTVDDYGDSCPSRAAALVIGLPGIGKSLFLQYILVERLFARRPTAVVVADEECFYFFDETGVHEINLETNRRWAEHRQAQYRYMDALFSENVWKLVDLPARVNKWSRDPEDRALVNDSTIPEWLARVPGLVVQVSSHWASYARAADGSVFDPSFVDVPEVVTGIDQGRSRHSYQVGDAPTRNVEPFLVGRLHEFPEFVLETRTASMSHNYQEGEGRMSKMQAQRANQDDEPSPLMMHGSRGAKTESKKGRLDSTMKPKKIAAIWKMEPPSLIETLAARSLQKPIRTERELEENHTDWSGYKQCLCCDWHHGVEKMYAS